MDDTWAILARTISQYTVHGAPKFMMFWSISLTQYMDTSERHKGPRVGARPRVGGAPTRASYYTYTHEPTTSPVTVDVLVDSPPGRSLAPWEA